MKKVNINSTLVMFLLGVAFSAYQIIEYYKTGCVNTFRAALACDEYSLVGHILIAVVSVFGAIKILLSKRDK